MNQVLVSNFYRHYGKQVKGWKNMILYAVDGSSVPLPTTEELRTIYGSSSNQYGEQVSITARICVLYDVLNEIVVKSFLHSYFVSEEKVVPQCLSGLDLGNKLLLFDRGYPSYWLMYLLMQQRAKFVMRIQSNANNVVKEFYASTQTDITVQWSPPASSLTTLTEMGFELIGQTAIKIRLVKVVLSTGETEILITNLYDEKVYTQESLREVYHLRWGIETHYNYVKNELQLGLFSGIRQICIEQDFAANSLLFNLQSLIEKQTQARVRTISSKRKYAYKVNKNISWATLKVRIVHLFLYHESRSILLELEKLFGNYLEPVRPNRKYPRKKKRNPNVKYYTVTNYKCAF